METLLQNLRKNKDFLLFVEKGEVKKVRVNGKYLSKEEIKQLRIENEDNKDV